MGLDLEHDCPECGGTEFWLTASTLVELGEKVKYDCSNCEYGFVRIDGTVDTSTA
jgi:rubredoxin